jgi:hypothetical protein
MKQTSRSALIEQMRTARLKQFAKLIFRATYIGRNPQTSQSMLEAVIHRRGNRRDFSYSRYPGNTSVVHFAERWVASWEVWSGSSYPPVLEFSVIARPDRVDRTICSIRRWLGDGWRIEQVTQQRLMRELALEWEAANG